MSEVIREVTAATGCRLRILDTQRSWLAERITLHIAQPVPFWKAVDRLCEAGRLQSNLGVDADGQCVSFFRNETIGPTSDFGAFRVQIEEIYFNRRYRKLHLGRDRSPPQSLSDEDQDGSFIELRVMVEPRMEIRNYGSLKGLSVMDDRGQSLLRTDPKSRPRNRDFGFTSAGYVLGRVPLKQVEQPGRMIRKVHRSRLSWSPCVGLRSVIPLEVAVGRSYRSDESIVTIRSVRKMTG